MGFFSEKKSPSPSSSVDHSQYPTTGYGDDVRATDNFDDDLHVECPSHTTESKLVRRIDLHVIPFLCILYLLGECSIVLGGTPAYFDSIAAFLDRVNIANANVYGMSKQLGLTGDK